MSDDSRKIFVNYRRALSTDFVHRLRDHLKGRGFDVFVDVQSIPSGKFADTILHQIEARPHFLAVLVPGSLERTTDADDWYRREIEHALHTRRNVIPLLAKGFSFAEEQNRLRWNSLPGRLEELKQYQYLSFIYEYDEQFQANIDVLARRFLVIPEETRVVPTPRRERETVREMLRVADVAKADQSGSDWILPLQSRFLFMPLPAPTLAAAAHGKLTWTAVTGAFGYLLQVSWDEAFSKPEEAYGGEATEFVQPSSLSHLTAFGAGATLSGVRSLLMPRHYRVKAKAGLGRLDSAWSNVVKVAPAPMPLPAPKLEGWSSALFDNLSWSAIEGAVGYTLQTSRDETFVEPEDAYSGEKTEFAQPCGLLGPLALAGLRGSLGAGKGAMPSVAAGLLGGAGTRYYRVRARAGPGRRDGAWSNVVRIEPPRPLPAPRLEPPATQGFHRKLAWTAVEGAAGYLLQTSGDEAFSQHEDLYTGPKTEFVDGGGGLPWIDVAAARIGKPAPALSRLLAASAPRYYRVKARGGPGRLDSPWSNVVEAT